jgi:hypothetical protein
VPQGRYGPECRDLVDQYLVEFGDSGASDVSSSESDEDESLSGMAPRVAFPIYFF